jgi:hypothetical protein
MALGAGIAAGAREAGVWSAAAAPIPAAIGVAVLQPRLYDVELLVNRTLRYALLSAAVVGIYVLIITRVGGMLGLRGSPWVAARAAAAVAVTLRRFATRSSGRSTDSSTVRGTNRSACWTGSDAPPQSHADAPECCCHSDDEEPPALIGAGGYTSLPVIHCGASNSARAI